MNDVAAPLLRWFEAQGRTRLPWREDRAPYRIVVSEFMLQQTQVERVIPLFGAFVARWPDFEALANAERADVLRAWKGLGYNSRAVRLHELARTVVRDYDGRLPRDVGALERLPGIGPYTARAIAAFAFDVPVAAADTNVRRVVHRTQYGVEFPPSVGVRELDLLAGAMVPSEAAFAFNSALMDLGATICTARAPKCLLCPLAATCSAAPLDARALADLARTHAPRRGPQAALAFVETTRFARGKIVDRLRELEPGQRISFLDLHADIGPHASAAREFAAFATIVDALRAEGIIDASDESLCLSR